jgi:hypothetical protein
MRDAAIEPTVVAQGSIVIISTKAFDRVLIISIFLLPLKWFTAKTLPSHLAKSNVTIIKDKLTEGLFYELSLRNQTSIINDFRRNPG